MSARCTRVWEAEAALDGRLGRDSSAAFERHAATCLECRTEIAALEALSHLARRAMPDDEPTPFDRRRRRLALQRRANEALLAMPRTRNRRWLSALTAMLVVAIALIAAARPAARADADGSVGRSLASNGELVRAALARWPLVAAPVTAGIIATIDEPVATSESVLGSAPVVAPAKPPPVGASSALAAGASSASSSDAGATFVAAMEAFHDGRYAEADALFVRFAGDAPSDSRCEDAAFLRAVAHSRMGDIAGARSLVAAYLAAYPDGLRRPAAERLATSLAK